MIGYFPCSIFNPSPNSTTHDHQSSSDQRFYCIKHEGSLLLECRSFEPSQDLRLTLLPQPTTMINYGFNFSFSCSRRPPYSQILARYDTPKHSRNPPLHITVDETSRLRPSTVQALHAYEYRRSGKVTKYYPSRLASIDK